MLHEFASLGLSTVPTLQVFSLSLDKFELFRVFLYLLDPCNAILVPAVSGIERACPYFFCSPYPEAVYVIKRFPFFGVGTLKAVFEF